MDDGVNRGDETDRIMVSWALASPPVATPSEDRVATTVAIPHDIETLRRESPMEAADWRFRVREEILGLLQDGLVVGGFDERGYLFTRA
jgi:predicted GNAT superfamily acetyltransferase